MPRDLNALRTGPQANETRHGLAWNQLWGLWPKNDARLNRRLVATIVMLALGAVMIACVPLIFAAAIDGFAGERQLVIAPIVMITLYVTMQWIARIFNEARWALYGPIEQRLRRRLAARATRHLHGLSLRFHLDRRTGSLSRILEAGLNGMRELLFDAVFLILPLLAEVLFVTVIMLIAMPPIFAFCLVVTLIFYGTVLIIGSEWLRAHQRQAAREASFAHGEAVDSLLNYETVKYFGREEAVADRYDSALARVEVLTVKALSYRSLLGFVLVTIIACGMAVILLLAGSRVQSGTMTLGELVLVNAYLIQLIRPMERLGQLYRSIKQALVDLEQLVEVLSILPDIVDRPAARPLEPGPGAIRFETVGFAYNPGAAGLSAIDFEIAPGSKTALVGPTGAGKSTIARLLFRFYEPSKGRILIDGQDILDVTQASLRAAIAVVPQDTVLFNDTLGYNIGFARENATISEIFKAAEAAGLGSFIEALERGLDTPVGERGLKLSGGEKQRVGIARAILKAPRIIILDEASSALDSATERDVQASIAARWHGRTQLVIAHRLSTIIDADQIIVLDQGRVVERGDHTSLLRQEGLYADLWKHQAELD